MHRPTVVWLLSGIGLKPLQKFSGTNWNRLQVAVPDCHRCTFAGTSCTSVREPQLPDFQVLPACHLQRGVVQGDSSS